MGLDNGIVLKSANVTNILQNAPWYTDLDHYFTVEKTGRIEVCYWRKCWGIRDEIISLLHTHSTGGDYLYIIEEDDIPEIIKIIEKFCNKDYYEAHARSIWEYEEELPRLLQQIKNLIWLREYLFDHSEQECYFYDSY